MQNENSLSGHQWRLITFLSLHCISIFSLVCSGKTANRDRLHGRSNGVVSPPLMERGTEKGDMREGGAEGLVSHTEQSLVTVHEDCV